MFPIFHTFFRCLFGLLYAALQQTLPYYPFLNITVNVGELILPLSGPLNLVDFLSLVLPILYGLYHAVQALLRRWRWRRRPPK